ncbi:pancreas/duodenum homeobox protein 1 [Desulfosediminicola flagellatus]|uniref:pancreas/duodenum homeobox protein 1 n=1 Tax=Desulfosediminicola flagellatus TaxID=2569541 RepID=UPI0010ABD922|nr:pancreas/duodenum homeobox protein 1 [Desulfosediminicola flagellatus]
MTTDNFASIFTTDTLLKLFPKDRADEFFDALFGDASEGAFDIALGFRGMEQGKLVMELLLTERPGHCLACNLTQGLPTVFSRHPIININGLVKEIDELLGDEYNCPEWSLGYTEQRGSSLHVIPIKIDVVRN